MEQDRRFSLQAGIGIFYMFISALFMTGMGILVKLTSHGTQVTPL